MANDALNTAISILKGQTGLARAISQPNKVITQAHVWGWLNSPNRDQMPPAEYCPAIERATDGLVRCEDLRPDVDWAVLRRCNCRDEAAHDERAPAENEIQEAA